MESYKLKRLLLQKIEEEGTYLPISAMQVELEEETNRYIIALKGCSDSPFIITHNIDPDTFTYTLEVTARDKVILKDENRLYYNHPVIADRLGYYIATFHGCNY